ncbi:FAD-dependent monooxygenase [Phytomonospora endophytica]|uniref:2-polyprenyl-6-methoxyphenol hydroxylase-like FAD-dependent oxidoreductase n=1 Tax=Phytomonospora endophytica TaxID=714109 RepID=A0A841FW90_9ACTN|nr:FAD-dependent monooxygenase [Phytomonospora endophytica]MBB6036749.1 2-polyprenyl-6-methoxyphenol hydroxylase-like FAD-dependent oxidoreductase [Phytomonospora endophytica]GIG68217.1 FAD-dependent oxidoreductase [Phytomonospora endophytica]
MMDASIIGGGIGGLTAAVALRRAGWNVEVFERADTLGEVGAGVAIAPNAVKALASIGLAAALDAVAMRLDGLEVRTRGGRTLTRVPGDMLQRRYGTPLYSLHRAELHRILRDAIGDVPLHTGATVTDVTPDGEFTVGGHRRRADLVVAADGVRSRVRAHLFPAHPGPSYAGYTVWRGIVPADAARGIDVAPRIGETWGRARRFGTVPFADGRVYWYAMENAPEGARPRHDVTALAERYAGWHRPIPELLAATPVANMIRHDVHYLRDPLAAFTAGKVALLGDAAHAVTPDIGQGACLAIEDGVVLAAVRDLADYDAQRRPRTQRIAAASGRLGRMLTVGNPAAVLVRDAVAGMTPISMSMRSIGSAYEWTPPIAA